MKKVILSIAVIAALIVVSCKSDSKKETVKTNVKMDINSTTLSFGVRGNCAMCKKTIEKAANSVDGVNSATWDVDKKKINVSFNDHKTNLLSIYKAIAASGYDTEKVIGNENAYKSLPGCCKYDQEMIMNQTSEINTENHSNHAN
tara:strand:- start:4507 stop:4941 length:435 start_codon:yes stop_codon:yes gene_type:complete